MKDAAVTINRRALAAWVAGNAPSLVLPECRAFLARLVDGPEKRKSA